MCLPICVDSYSGYMANELGKVGTETTRTVRDAHADAILLLDADTLGPDTLFRDYQPTA
jgi:hypothetical protein